MSIGDFSRDLRYEGLALVISGALFGEALAFAITRALGAWFSGLADITKTSTSDPWLLIGAPALLGALTIAACYIPARRSIQIDPAVTLREE